MTLLIRVAFAAFSRQMLMHLSLRSISPPKIPTWIPWTLVIPSRLISWKKKKTHFLIFAGSAFYQIWLWWLPPKSYSWNCPSRMSTDRLTAIMLHKYKLTCINQMLSQLQKSHGMWIRLSPYHIELFITSRTKTRWLVLKCSTIKLIN